MNRRGINIKSLIFCALVAAVPHLGHGQTVANGDFSDPLIAEWDFSYNTDGGTWSFLGGTGISGAAGPWAPNGGAGSQFAFLQISEGSPTASFSQTITFSSAGVYDLSYLEGTRAGYVTTQYTVSLTRISDSFSAFSVSDSSAEGQSFESVIYSVTVPTAASYLLTFTSVPGGDLTDRAAAFDNVSFTYVSAVPEPSTWGMIASVAALSFVIWRRRTAGPGA